MVGLPKTQHQHGFTLIELIVVIVLLGIISVGTTGFIVSSVKGFSDQSRRQGIAAAGRIAMDRLVREVRNALPNSVRTTSDASGTCLEYIPIQEATQYIDAPVGFAADSLSVIPFSDTPRFTANQSRVAVYPISTAAVYREGALGAISSTVSSTPASLVASNAVTLTLNSAHQFERASPRQRLFFVDQPVSVCLVGDRLYRYSNYTRRAAQPTPSSLPSTEPDRGLLAYPVSAATPFRVIDATLQRNALVLLEFSVTNQGESLLIQQEVQIRNAP
ncbi:PilW family protein [Neptunomonas sp.]|uniref:PilW family protein n=1 Tax=Neptunomonas TaxID=75687 RepID=UPI003517D4EC